MVSCGVVGDVVWLVLSGSRGPGWKDATWAAATSCRVERARLDGLTRHGCVAMGNGESCSKGPMETACGPCCGCRVVSSGVVSSSDRRLVSAIAIEAKQKTGE